MSFVRKINNMKKVLASSEEMHSNIDKIDIESKYFKILGFELDDDVIFNYVSLKWKVDVDTWKNGITISPYVPDQSVIITGRKDDVEFEKKIFLKDISIKISKDNDDQTAISLSPSSFEIYENECCVYFGT